MAEFYRVREPFWLTTKQGVPRVCTAGEILSGDDPDLKGREQFCDKLADFIARAQAVTETASAAPGEVRARRGRPRLHKSQPAVPTPEPAPAVGDEPESEL